MVVVDGIKYQKANPQIKDMETPPEFYKELDGEFHFTLDAAADSNNALAFTYCTKYGTFNKKGELVSPHDGLGYDWAGHRVFCNPPYDKNLYAWVAKAAERAADVCVMLLPPNIDTKWFHDHSICPKCNHNTLDDRTTVLNGKEWGYWWTAFGCPHIQVLFLKGRLKFYYKGEPTKAPRAGNMIIIFRSDTEAIKIYGR